MEGYIIMLNGPHDTIWRGLWTWPPWVICAPAFNHKLKKFCIYRGFSKIVFFRKPHKWTGELRTGQRKVTPMDHCATETHQLANQFKMVGRWIKSQETQLLLDVVQHCSVLVFPMQKFLCRKFRDFTLRNKALVYLPTYKNHQVLDLSLCWTSHFTIMHTHFETSLKRPT